jgi:hypothetical protein
MKKIIRLTEADLTRLVKRIIKEQGQEKNPSECAKNYVKFLFKTSIMDDDNETVLDGGDLFYWNNNKFPTMNNLEAYERFLNHLKGVMEDGLFSDEECTDTTFEDIEPFVKKLYIDKIKKSRGNTFMTRRLPSSDIIDKVINDPENDPNNFSDEFEYADNIIEYIIDEIIGNSKISQDEKEKIENYIKEQYSEMFFERYRSEVGDNEFEF